jgi:hypothetical protein
VSRRKSFLFSDRADWKDPLSRFEVTAVFHGHAHKGAPEGRTQTGIPVYNVSLSVLKANYPDQPTFRLFEVRTVPPDEQSVTPIGDRRYHGRRATDRADSDTKIREPVALVTAGSSKML